MKKFLFKCSLFIVLIGALLLVTIHLDIFNVFHPLNIRNNGVEPNKNYIKMTYILANPDKFDSFMFGSSRVGDIHVEKIEDCKCYNMSYSNGLPSEHLNNIKTFLQNGLVPRKIYIGVDSVSYSINKSDHYSQQLWMPYEFIKAKPLNLIRYYADPAITFSGLKDLLKRDARKTIDPYIFYEYGWNHDYEMAVDYTFLNQAPKTSSGKTLYMKDALDAISEIKDICSSNGIELIVFTNPMYELAYKDAVSCDYFSFLEQLATVTPFYNFSGINNVTTDIMNYYDYSHYKPEVGDMLIDCMCNGMIDKDLCDQGFGTFATSDNINKVLSLLKNQLADDKE